MQRVAQQELSKLSLGPLETSVEYVAHADDIFFVCPGCGGDARCRGGSIIARAEWHPYDPAASTIAPRPPGQRYSNTLSGRTGDHRWPLVGGLRLAA